MLDLLYCNFARPADARWLRVLGILDRGDLQATVNRDSGPGNYWIWQGLRFEQARRSQGELDVVKDYTVLWLAYCIYEESGTGGHERKATIEARILARQSDAEIAAAQGCHPEVIAAYEGLFFNVRDRLDAPLYICQGLLGRLFTAPETCDHGMCLRYLAYVGGPKALEEFLWGSCGNNWVTSREGVTAWLESVANSATTQKAIVSLLTMRMDDRNCAALARANAKLQRVELKSIASKGSPSQREHVDALVKGIMKTAQSPTAKPTRQS